MKDRIEYRVKAQKIHPRVVMEIRNFRKKSWLKH